ncbi:hypothetical protein QUF80_04495 [Desulfococcaceae bacterium HSG8]|nr:hypothetical protein [Desulfococcaceae bacterium HSG8]
MNCQRAVKYNNLLFYKLNGFNTNYQRGTFKWKDEDRFEKGGHVSSGEIIQILGVRNNLAHFNCFSKEANYENRKKIGKLMLISKKYIELLIETYPQEMENKTFKEIIRRFKFARIGDF